MSIFQYNGNVGIGTSSPESSLHVAGTRLNTPTTRGIHMGLVGGLNNGDCAIELCAGSDTTSSFIDFTYPNTDRRGRINYVHSSDYFQIETSSTERLRINTTGLCVQNNLLLGNSLGTQSILTLQGQSINNTGGLGFYSWGLMKGSEITTSGQINVFSDGYNRFGSGIIFDGSRIRFLTHSTDGATMTQGYTADSLSRIFIDDTGNVGIGTSNPSKTLSINGDAELGIANNDYHHLRIGGGNSSGFLFGQFNALADGVHLSYNHYYNSAGNLVIINTGGTTTRMSVGYTDINFYTTNTPNTAPNQSLVIKGSGNVGVGGITPTEKLQVNGNMVVSDRDGLGFHLGFRPIKTSGFGEIYCYDHTVNEWAPLNINEAGNVYLSRNAGNVGIGTSSPSHKLDVNGTIKCDSLIINNTTFGYEENSATYRFLGTNTSQADVIVKIVKIATLVTVSINPFTLVTGAVSTDVSSTTSIPLQFRPSATSSIGCFIVKPASSGVSKSAYFSVQSSGTMIFTSADTTTGAFPANQLFIGTPSIINLTYSL